MTPFNSNPLISIPTLDEFIERTPNVVKSTIKDKIAIVTRWNHIIESNFEGIRLKKEALENICIYCEVCYLYYENIRNIGYKVIGNEIAGILQEIKSNLLNGEPNRSEVKSKVYNYQTGCMEYELSDGNFVKILNESVDGPKIDISNDIFCQEFVKHLDISTYRDIKIDKLL